MSKAIELWARAVKKADETKKSQAAIEESKARRVTAEEERTMALKLELLCTLEELNQKMASLVSIARELIGGGR